MFQVVAVDETGDCVEIQDCDGDVDEVDLEAWFAMPLEPAAAPEDPNGAIDDADAGDREYPLSADGAEHAWRDPLDNAVTELGDLDEADDEGEDAPLHH
jgi:hypothetical protein